MRYYIQSNDGRFVTQHGSQPALTDNPRLAYTWNAPSIAKRLLPAYLAALKHTGILALAVMPEILDCRHEEDSDKAREL